ncbi:hypothetical protein GCM10009560_34230 [Nonomuraea longicatena]|uniref:Uncharacterized protein n=1 Tax=Nonomuraea longicatena TaxID=83682 RepID=A0ABN1PMT9_9ACTN
MRMPFSWDAPTVPAPNQHPVSNPRPGVEAPAAVSAVKRHPVSDFVREWEAPRLCRR